MALSEGSAYYRKEKVSEYVLQEAIRQLFTFLPVLFLTLAVAFFFTVSVTFTLTALLIAGTGSAIYFFMPRPLGPLFCLLFVALGSLFAINMFFYSGESVFSAGWLLVFFQEVSFELYGLFNQEFILEISSPSTGAFLVYLVAVFSWISFYYRFSRGGGMVYLFIGSLLMLLMLYAGNPVGLFFVLFLISVVMGLPLEKAPAQKFDSVIINERGKEKFWNIRIGTGLLAIIIVLILAALLFLLWLPPSSDWWPAVVEGTDRGITIFYANDFPVQLEKDSSGTWLWIAGEIILLLFLIVTVMTYRNRLRPLHLGIVLLVAFGVFILRGIYSVEYLPDLPINLPLLFLRSVVFMFLAGLFFVWRPNLVPLAILFFFFLPVMLSPGMPDNVAFSGLEDLLERAGKDDAFPELFEMGDDSGAEDETEMESEEGIEEEPEETVPEDDDETAGFSLPAPVPDSGMEDSDISMDQELQSGEEEDGVSIDPRIIKGLLESFVLQDDADAPEFLDETDLDDQGEVGLTLEHSDEESVDDESGFPGGIITGEPGEDGRTPHAEERGVLSSISNFLSKHLSWILGIIVLVVSILALWLFYPYIIKILKSAGPFLTSLAGYFKDLWKALYKKLYNAMPAWVQDYLETLDADPDRREYYRQLRTFSRRFPRQRSETPREYCNRLFIISAREEEKRLNKKQIEDFKKLTHHFEEVRYR